MFMSASVCFKIITYHGAKNLINTLFPAVAVSKFSGVNTVTSAVANARRVDKMDSLI